MITIFYFLFIELFSSEETNIFLKYENRILLSYIVYKYINKIFMLQCMVTIYISALLRILRLRPPYVVAFGMGRLPRQSRGQWRCWPWCWCGPRVRRPGHRRRRRRVRRQRRRGGRPQRRVRRRRVA